MYDEERLKDINKKLSIKYEEHRKITLEIAGLFEEVSKVLKSDTLKQIVDIARKVVTNQEPKF